MSEGTSGRFSGAMGAREWTMAADRTSATTVRVRLRSAALLVTLAEITHALILNSQALSPKTENVFCGNRPHAFRWHRRPSHTLPNPSST
eukprot:3336448-Pleurochrysis_carterae.AAC.1